MRRVILAVGTGLLLVASAVPAFGQAYPPGGGSVFLGNASVGGTISGDLCGFPAGSQATVNVNGTGGQTGPTDANGCKHVTIQISSQTQGILGDPVNVTIQCGSNSVTATGSGVTSNGTFNVVCAAATPAAAPTSRVAFTGANILRWSVAAVALLALGALMVWGTRRRRPTLER
jgi:hypothetical protein